MLALGCAATRCASGAALDAVRSGVLQAAATSAPTERDTPASVFHAERTTPPLRRANRHWLARPDEQTPGRETWLCEGAFQVRFTSRPARTRQAGNRCVR